MEKKDGYIKLNIEETEKLIENEKELIILDTRTEEEYLYEGKIENSILLDYLKPRIFKKELLTYDRDKVYLVYCAVGRVSEPAAKFMVDLGFSKVYEMDGGLKKWQKEKHLELTVSKLDTEEVIEYRKSIVKRLNKIEGQIKGVKKMLMDGEHCGDILNQSLAIKSALSGANQEIMEMFSKRCVNSIEEKEDFYRYLKKLIK